jgi:hypothetical protein
MLNFTGRGYDECFTAALSALIAALEAQPETPVRLARVADDVCAACPNLSGGRCADGEKVGALDEGWLRETGLSGDETLPWGELRRRYADRMTGEALRRVCGACQWLALCTEITEARTRE